MAMATSRFKLKAPCILDVGVLSCDTMLLSQPIYCCTYMHRPWCGGRSVAMPVGIKASDSSILTKQVGVVGYGDHWMKIGHNRGAEFTDVSSYIMGEY
jgi:hypothetical protein